MGQRNCLAELSHCTPSRHKFLVADSPSAPPVLPGFSLFCKHFYLHLLAQWALKLGEFHKVQTLKVSVHQEPASGIKPLHHFFFSTGYFYFFFFTIWPNEFYDCQNQTHSTSSDWTNCSSNQPSNTLSYLSWTLGNSCCGAFIFRTADPYNTSYLKQYLRRQDLKQLTQHQ